MDELTTYDPEPVVRMISLGKFDQAFHLAYPAAVAGLKDAQCTLGYLYQMGHGIQQSGAQAVYWYGLAAKQCNAIAWNNLGTIYKTGLPEIEPDHEKSRQCYQRAQELGFDAMQISDSET